MYKFKLFTTYYICLVVMYLSKIIVWLIAWPFMLLNIVTESWMNKNKCWVDLSKRVSKQND